MSTIRPHSSHTRHPSSSADTPPTQQQQQRSGTGAGGVAPSPFGTTVAQSPFAGSRSPYQTPLLGHGAAAGFAATAAARLRRNAQQPTAAAPRTHSPATRHSVEVGAHSTASASPPPPLVPLPLSADSMSCHALLSLHLNDEIELIAKLLESLDPATQGVAITSNNHAAGSSAAVAAASATAAAISCAPSALIDRLIRKDQLLQAAVENLLAHQSLHRSLQQKRTVLAELDARVVSFCARLGILEQSLLTAASDGRPLKALGGTELKSQRFLAHDVLVFSEQLARMSFAPSDHLERRGGGLNEAVTRPPAPLEKRMAHSVLHLSLDEMIQIIDSEEKAKAEAEEAKASDSAADSAAMEIDLAHMPGSLTALGRQESAPAASSSVLPSFAELAQGTAGVAGTPQMWRQESAHRPMASVAPVALDLDLESSDSESDDD